MKSAENIVVFPGARERKEREELAFLPAALEIIETPPSPIGRAIALLIMLFFCLALAWAGFGTVDIVASAPGKIIPSGRTKDTWTADGDHPSVQGYRRLGELAFRLP